MDLDATQQPTTEDVPLTILPPESGRAEGVLDVQTPALQSDAQTRKPSKLAASLQPDFVEAAARVIKEEENERAGQIKDRLIASANVISNSLHRSRQNNDALPEGEEDIGDEALPHKKNVSPPPVAYLKDVVIDMAGYHSKQESDQTVTGAETEMERRYRFDDYITASAATKAQQQLM